MRLEREQERHICKMCYDREIDAVILPCSHRVVCFRSQPRRTAGLGKVLEGGVRRSGGVLRTL